MSKKPNLMDGDYDNVMISPDGSPQGSPRDKNEMKIAGGRYVPMA